MIVPVVVAVAAKLNQATPRLQLVNAQDAAAGEAQ
jgi:hypothetical protein